MGKVVAKKVVAKKAPPAKKPVAKKVVRQAVRKGEPNIINKLFAMPFIGGGKGVTLGPENIVAHVERRLPLDRRSMLAAAYFPCTRTTVRGVCGWQYLSTRSVVVSSVSSG